MYTTTTTGLLAFAARLQERIQSGMRAIQFEPLALELFGLQFENNRSYRTICEARGATPENIRNWHDIPAVPTSAFKELELTSLPPGQRSTVFYSSGTTAHRRSRHFHSFESLSLYETAVLAWFEQNVTAQPMRVLCLIPGALEAPNSSLAHMFETVRRRFGKEDAEFIGRVAADDGWNLDLDRGASVLHHISQAGEPALVMGTAFSFVHLLDDLAERNLRFALPAGSLVMETGGYKGRSRSLPKAELHSLISEYFGIGEGQIVCEYGMSELSSQAYGKGSGILEQNGEKPLKRLEAPLGRGSTQLKLGVNERGVQRPARSRRREEAEPNSDRESASSRRRLQFQLPPWARAQIISPETGDELGEGETGLIRVFDLANVFSVMAIQTEDLAVKRSNGFDLLGRATLAEPRGCSLMAVS